MAAQQIPREAMIGVDLEPSLLKFRQHFPGLFRNPRDRCPGEAQEQHLLILCEV